MTQPSKSEDNLTLESLKANLASLEAWMASSSFVGFCEARNKEVQLLDFEIARFAPTWEDIIRLRAQRDNILSILSSFEETRSSLSEKIDELVEKSDNTATTENQENENDDMVVTDDPSETDVLS